MLLSAPKNAMPASSEVRIGNLNHTAKEAAVPAKRRRNRVRRRAKIRQCEPRREARENACYFQFQLQLKGNSGNWFDYLTTKAVNYERPVPCEISGMRNAGLQTLQYISTVLVQSYQYQGSFCPTGSSGC